MAEQESLFKEIMNDHTDCFMCRAVSSFALCASGAFLYQQRNNFGRVNMYFQSVLGLGLIYVGFARGMAFPPFENTEFAEMLRRRKEQEAKGR